MSRKGRDRNQPCPCGSGLKFKRCCWDLRLAPATLERLARLRKLERRALALKAKTGS